jgi:hypothetical protein
MPSGQLYPYVLEPKLTQAIWGGDALVGRFGKSGDPATKLGESWECWDENRVTNGAVHKDRNGYTPRYRRCGTFPRKRQRRR